MSKTTGKRFNWLSLYLVGQHWRLTTCRIAGRRVTRRLGKKQANAERYAAQVSEWIEQYKAKLITDSKLLALLGESLPVDQLLAQYKSHLKSKGRNAEYISTIVPRLRILMEKGDIVRATQITIGSVNRGLDKLKTDGHGGRVLSDQTIRHYSRAIRQFVGFLMKPPHKIFELDPLIGIDSRPVDKKVRPRRAPTPAELLLLLGHVMRQGQGLSVFSLTGEDRAMLYAFAISTGLRAGELREVKVGWVDLSKGVVAVPGEHTKNGEPAHQPLPQWLVDRASVWLKGRAPTASLWPAMPKQLAVALRTDQATARAEWVEAATDEGERTGRAESDTLLYKTAEGYFDFHSLRHAYVTRVVNSGASVKTAQSLARHSTPMLTIGLYSHVEAAALRPQVDAAIPNPLG